MDKIYEVEFCWLTKLPALVVFDGTTKDITARHDGRKTVVLTGKNVPNVLDRMRGTDTKLVSCINRIKEC